MSYSVVTSRVKRGSLVNSEPREADMSVFLAEVTTGGGDGAGKGAWSSAQSGMVSMCGSSYSTSSARLDECGIIGNT
jgi:hypothetical protein